MLRDEMPDALSGKARKLFDEFNRSYLIFLAIVFVCLVCDRHFADVPSPFWAFAAVMGLTGLSIAARRCINSLLMEQVKQDKAEPEPEPEAPAES